jgi:pectin methylesterase-like acyl-CoA thioesterase
MRVNYVHLTEASMAKLLCVAVLSFLGSLVLPMAVAAQQTTILHVDRTDPTCGGQSPCFSTIQAAINAAGSGNVIHIEAGTYPEQLSITGKNNFQGVAEVDRIVIEADPATNPGQVVVTGAPGACTGNYAVRLQQSKFITIRGLTITGTGGQAISLSAATIRTRTSTSSLTVFSPTAVAPATAALQLTAAIPAR